MKFGIEDKMKKNLKLLYRRYNQLGIDNSIYTVQRQYTMIQIYREFKERNVDIEKRIAEIEFMSKYSTEQPLQKLLSDSYMVQPKSVFLRMYYIGLIAQSVPESVYIRWGCSAETIIEISVAIAMYYNILQAYSFKKTEMTGTEKKYLLGRTDFYFGIDEIKLVRGKTLDVEFDKYISLFAKDVESIDEGTNIGLFRDGTDLFIICIEDFLDYIIFEIENLLRKEFRGNEYNEFTTKKGAYFEELVHSVTQLYFEKTYHTLYYYPNKEQRIEVDVVATNRNELVVLECKSGTFNLNGITEDEILKLKLKSKTVKAYSSLNRVAEYMTTNKEYMFEGEGGRISGEVKSPCFVHVTMYPMDFISSNLHVIFPDYLKDTNNPILSISLEHLFAIIIESKRNNRDIFEYWRQRIIDIQEHPKMTFDNNELDLYYEIVNSDKGSMLSLIKENGIFERLSPNAIIASSFHNEFGEEFRPAKEYINALDEYLFLVILEKGKAMYGINKRYLKNIVSFLRIDEVYAE